ncbi:MAG TPA: MarR family transcriptional regulator [Caldithrix abyssi]|uniref:MarR family transcriptional regulator n=1 Tax=Caldithrix abyssi TaxID=187145 RepID=A0A7V4WTY0_CALAY|nr:MarR family transcriptional regulator [Caldithrix abyssi]
MPDHYSRTIAEYSRILSQMLCEVIEHNYLIKQVPLPINKTQFSILKILKISGPYLVSEIADILQISRAAASKNVDKLVHFKLVKRRIIAKDRRTTQVSLLKMGERIVEEYENVRELKQNAALSRFTEKEQKQLAELLGKYVRECLQQEQEIDLICLQCNGSIRNECELSEHRDRCRFYYQMERKTETK